MEAGIRAWEAGIRAWKPGQAIPFHLSPLTCLTSPSWLPRWLPDFLVGKEVQDAAPEPWGLLLFYPLHLHSNLHIRIINGPMGLKFMSFKVTCHPVMGFRARCSLQRSRSDQKLGMCWGASVLECPFVLICHLLLGDLGSETPICSSQCLS